jgi:hypothetical protein
MSLRILNNLSAALLAGLLAMAASPVAGAHLGRSTIADGIAVHLGIMPAEVLRAHPERYPRHDGAKIPAGKNVYHVMAALFDDASGARITDADVVATVAPLGLGAAAKHLDPTIVAGAVTYCNYLITSRCRRGRTMSSGRGSAAPEWRR